MKYRPRRTVLQEPSSESREGVKAAWWREHTQGLSRPGLARQLGVSAKTIEREEARDEVSTEYRLACAALDYSLADWKWKGTVDSRVIPKRQRERDLERLDKTLKK